MSKIISLLTILAISISCDYERIYVSDIDKLIKKQTIENEVILKEMKTFVDKHGEEYYGFHSSVAKDCAETHKKVLSFIDSLDFIDNALVHEKTIDFFTKNIERIDIQYPKKLYIDKETPKSLIKLQLVEMENLYLRIWESVVSFRFDKFESVIVPEKIDFQDGTIEGNILLIGYAQTLNKKVMLNNTEIQMKNGKAYFKTSIDSLNGSELSATIMFTDTSYTTKLKYR